MLYFNSVMDVIELGKTFVPMALFLGSLLRPSRSYAVSVNSPLVSSLAMPSSRSMLGLVEASELA